jgi:cytosine/adenosine deaminase-related metal-dependent hydrolase
MSATDGHGLPRTKLTARYVVAWDAARRQHTLLEDGEVVYAGDQIVFTGHDYPGPVAETMTLGNALIGPGFIDLDALADLDSTVLGFDNTPGWRKGRVWASSYVERGPREVYTAAQEDFQRRYAFIQLLLNGVTTILPIRSLLYRAWAESYDEFARAAAIVAELGIRAYLGPSYRSGLSMVRPDGTFAVHWDAEAGLRGLDEAIAFVRDFDGAHAGLVRGFLQPDRIECCTIELLERTATAAAELDVPLRLHCCQSELEVRTVQERFGTSSLDVLRALGVLSRRAVLPHGQFLGGAEPTPARVERELGWLAEAGATVAHCPIVSARHGGFLDSFARFKRHGVNIGLGTDTWPPDVIQNMHAGVMLSRVMEGSMQTSAADYYTAATVGGADALGRADLGRLAAGALADIVVFDLSGFHLGPLVDPIQSLLLSGSGRDVRTVIVAGRMVVRERQITGVDVDVDALREQAQRQYDTLRASYPERTHLHPPVDEIFAPAFPLVRREQGRGTVA